jgi:hypothetical protein
MLNWIAGPSGMSLGGFSDCEEALGRDIEVTIQTKVVHGQTVMVEIR